VNRGNLLRALGRQEEALSSYGEGLVIEPGHVEARSQALQSADGVGADAGGAGCL